MSVILMPTNKEDTDTLAVAKAAMQIVRADTAQDEERGIRAQFGLCGKCRFMEYRTHEVDGTNKVYATCDAWSASPGANGVLQLRVEAPVRKCSRFGLIGEVPLPILLELATIIGKTGADAETEKEKIAKKHGLVTPGHYL